MTEFCPDLSGITMPTDNLAIEVKLLISTFSNLFCYAIYIGILLISFRYVLTNLQPGEAVIIVDYKMKLELGMRSREIQRDWYGKRGISLHGFYVIAQVGVDERTEVLDLWSEDTKQDAWFTQSAFDIGFSWMEKVFPNFQVYLFSGKYIII